MAFFAGRIGVPYTATSVFYVSISLWTIYPSYRNNIPIWAVSPGNGPISFFALGRLPAPRAPYSPPYPFRYSVNKLRCCRGKILATDAILSWRDKTRFKPTFWNEKGYLRVQKNDFALKFSKKERKIPKKTRHYSGNIGAIFLCNFQLFGNL